MIEKTGQKKTLFVQYLFKLHVAVYKYMVIYSFRSRQHGFVFKVGIESSCTETEYFARVIK